MSALNHFLIEAIGWISTALFLLSIVIRQRVHLHVLGVFTAVTTGVYAYAHDATAIWVKWIIALFFHAYMWVKLTREEKARAKAEDERN
jgi:hypothetical protein